jgi:hypothetical protein
MPLLTLIIFSIHFLQYNYLHRSAQQEKFPRGAELTRACLTAFRRTTNWDYNAS